MPLKCSCVAWRVNVETMAQRNPSPLMGSVYLRSIKTLSVGVLASQVLMGVSTLLIARQITASEFGKFSIYVTLVMILSVGAAAKLEAGLISPPPDVSETVMALVAKVTVVCASALFLVGIWLLFRLDMVESLRLAGPLSLLVPAGVLATGLYNIFNGLCLQRKLIEVVAWNRVAQTTVQCALQLLLTFGWGTALGLVIGDLGGRGFGIANLKSKLRECSVAISWPEVVKSVSALRKYFIFSGPAAYVNVWSLYIPPIAIAGIYDVASAGQFALIQRLLGLPVSLLVGSLGQAFLVETSQYRSEPMKVRATFVRSLLILLPIGAVMYGSVILFAPRLLTFVLGNTWAEAGAFILPVAACCLGELLASPLSNVVYVFQRQQVQFGLDLVRLLLVAFIFHAAKVAHLPMAQTIGLYAGVITVVYVVSIIAYYRIVR